MYNDVVNMLAYTWMGWFIYLKSFFNYQFSTRHALHNCVPYIRQIFACLALQ